MYLHEVLNCSLFASGLFHIFKDLSWDWISRPHNAHSSLNKTALGITQRTHTKHVTRLNSAEWPVLTVSPATCLMQDARKGGPAAARAQPRWVHVKDWTCLQFLDLVQHQRCNIAQLICTLAPAVYKPMLNSAAWDIPQAQCMNFEAVMQWCSWLLLSLVLPPALAASSSLSIVS